MNIYQKLLEVQKKVKGLEKDSQGFNYSYVSGSKVIGAIKPLMNELGLILKTDVLECTPEHVRTTNGRGKEVLDVLYTLKLKFTWIDVDNGDKDENIFFSCGANGLDKGIGSALTYAERYFLLKYFHIATDADDVDAVQPLEEPKETLTKEKEKENKVEDKQAPPLSQAAQKAISMINRKFEDKEDLLNSLLINMKIESLNAATVEQLKEIYEVPLN